MAHITTNGGVGLEYETYGSPEDPTILMVMGFGTQLLGWPRGFCEHLAGGRAGAGTGRYVIAFDNRDTGLSQRFSAIAPIDEILAAAGAGDWHRARELAPYTLSDLADDALGLLAALGITEAHVLGASMGGFIAQTMAIEHPGRLLSLTSMMSSTGEPEYGQAAPASLAALLEPSPPDRAGYIAASVRWLLWHSRRYPEAEETARLAGESYDRAYYPEGVTRQLGAMIAGPPRADALRHLTVPTLVIHGTDDTLIAPSGGQRTAELIPGAKLVLIEDMGHDRPRPLWDTICAPIWEHTAENRSPSAR